MKGTDRGKENELCREKSASRGIQRERLQKPGPFKNAYDKFRSSKAGTVIRSAINKGGKKKNRKEATDEERQKWRELYAQAERLEQEMASLAVGRNGMVLQRDFFRETENPALKSEYQKNFYRRQERLCAAYENYYKLQKKVEELPESAGKRIPELERKKLYVELLEETLT